MRTTSILALAVVMAAPAAAQTSDPTGVSRARDELLADFEDALALKLQHCEFDVSQDDSFQWIALPSTYPTDPYLNEADQRQAATEWLVTEWKDDGPFPKRYEWEFRLMWKATYDTSSPDRGVYSWDPESQRLFAEVSFALPVGLDPGVEGEVQFLPDEITGPGYPSDRAQHLPRVVCSSDECQVSVRPGLDVRTARRLAILDREIPVTLRLEVVVEPGGEQRKRPSTENSGPTRGGTPPWGCWRTVGEMRVEAWELSIDGRRYAGG